MAVGLDLEGVKSWYKVTLDDFYRFGFRENLKSKYKSSIYLLLKEAFPEKQWDPWRFRRFPREVFSDFESMRPFLPLMEKELNILHPNDWNHVRSDELKDAGLFYFFKKNGVEKVVESLRR